MNNKNLPIEAGIIAIRATAEEASKLNQSLLAKTTIIRKMGEAITKKVMKKYLCSTGESEDGFLIAAENIQEAELDAKQWNMTVEAVWYDHPDNRGLDGKQEFM